MRYSEAGNRYAEALFHLSESKISLKEREEVLNTLAHLEKDVPKFHQFLLNPLITKKQKSAVLHKIISDTLLVHFLLFLLDKGKWHLLPAIAFKYQQLSEESRGIIRAAIISSEPLDSAIKKKFKEKIEDRFQKSVLLFDQVDPKLLGGAIFIVGNKIADVTIRGRLNQLKRALLCD